MSDNAEPAARAASEPEEVTPPPPREETPPAAGAVADGNDRSLAPDSVTVARITGGIASAVLAGVSLIGAIIALFTAPLGPLAKLLMLAGWGVFVAILITLALYMPTLRYRYTSYRVDGNGFTVRRGVIWRSVTSVPKSRIQHTDVSQGPLERGFKLSTLVIHTAGTENASVSLSGLAHEDALRIRDYLIEGGEEHAV